MPAAQAKSDSGGLNISVTVPEVCHLQAPDVVLTPSQNRFSAQVFEMCNGTSAFRVIASHRDLSDGETIAVTYGGQFSRLNAVGISDIAFRQGPFIGNRPIAIDAVNLKGPIAISLGMTPV